MNHAYLIGMRGVGKSTIGRILAKKLGRDFLDLDDMLAEEEQMSLLALVQSKGWPYFRKREQGILKKIAQRKTLVVATGGGILTTPGNSELLRKSGKLILLTASTSEIRKRLEGDRVRPSITGKPFLEELDDLWNQRKEQYYRCADLVLDSKDRTPQEFAHAISIWMKKL